MSKINLLFSFCLFLIPLFMSAHKHHNDGNQFKQLYTDIPTPNAYHLASGAPGPSYYQQQVDYVIEVTLDENKQRIDGQELITYTNNAPEQLGYLWIQLDQNVLETGGIAKETRPAKMLKSGHVKTIERINTDYDAGFKINSVELPTGEPLEYTIVETMMRIELPNPLQSGEQFQFKIDWWFNVMDRAKVGGRSGLEYFEEGDDRIFTIAQFYPRLCKYTNDFGWQNKQFLGAGEFALEFGNFDVKITTAADHIVGATGEIQNIEEVLTSTQIERFEKAKQSTDAPVFIVTKDEAVANEKQKSDKLKTWHFKADNVRDFAFASSRKFLWDAMAVEFDGHTTMAMSLFPNEGNPLWSQYSTKVVAHTLKTYSKYTFDYPYPVCYSVHTDRIGMEYPMISFNGNRPKADGSYSETTKSKMIAVIVHEVGHNFFPMIINSDERQWGWMDEGFNSFYTSVAVREFDPTLTWKASARTIVDFMKETSSDPSSSSIMIGVDHNTRYRNNSYSKPATGLSILRETILGRELFDYAMSVYAERWMFKNPTPADFFRTMEDATGVDLDWFWRTWFFGTGHVDLAIDNVRVFQYDDGSLPFAGEETAEYIELIRDQEQIETAISKDKSLEDQYSNADQSKVDAKQERYRKLLKNLTDEEREMIEFDAYFYEITFQNRGDIAMPLIVEFEFEDGSKEVRRTSAQIWRQNILSIAKVYKVHKPVKQITLDPYWETADVDIVNNSWPRTMKVERIKVKK